MSSSKVDCHFFLNSTCLKGDKCQFRHSEGARQTHEVCPAFRETGQCPEDDCGKRHTVEQITRTTKGPADIPCRNEENGGVCTRPDCIFKHSQRANTPAAILVAGVRPPRPSASDSSGNRLNAGAKAFVPMGKLGQQRPVARPRPNMEWTPDSNTNKVQARTFVGDKQWRPSAAGVQGITARPPARPFANKEWTPASAAATASTGTGVEANASSNAKANGFSKPSGFVSKTFGQSPFASKDSAFGKANAFGNAGNSMFARSTGMHRPQTDISPAAMSDIDVDISKDKEQDDDDVMDVDTTQGSFEQTQTRTRILTQTQALVRNQQPTSVPVFNAFTTFPNKGTAFAKPPVSTKSSIPTIFDILGIEEQKPAPTNRQRRSNPWQTTQPSTSAQQPLPVQTDRSDRISLTGSIPAPEVTYPTAEQIPASSAYKCNSRRDAQTAYDAQKTSEALPSSSCDRLMNNSPLSNVCYTSEFPDYMGMSCRQKVEAPPRPPTPEPISMSMSVSASEAESEAKTSADAKEPTGAHQDHSLDTKAMEVAPLPLQATSKPIPNDTLASSDLPTSRHVSKPASSKRDDSANGIGNKTGIKSDDLVKSDGNSGGARDRSSSSSSSNPNTNAQLPKILSFQEIMERKRRKKADAEAEAARLAKENPEPSDSVAATPAVSEPNLSDSKYPSLHRTSAKRRVINDDSDDIDSDVSEGKRAKISLSSNSSAPLVKRPEVTNYVAMFEKELADINLDLSGPLTNSPASDRISKANIKDSYFDADLANILAST
ncbi:hypothetical protein LPJ57_004097 [Coemansia sp. RSA 486]|nr:hypothetical protein LPJ57_004097 [Coemansia sp. RSA 486]